MTRNTVPAPLSFRPLCAETVAQDYGVKIGVSVLDLSRQLRVLRLLIVLGGNQQKRNKFARFEISDLKPREFIPLLLIAAQVYKEPKYAELAGKIEDGNPDLDTVILRDGLRTKGSK